MSAANMSAKFRAQIPSTRNSMPVDIHWGPWPVTFDVVVNVDEGLKLGALKQACKLFFGLRAEADGELLFLSPQGEVCTLSDQSQLDNVFDSHFVHKERMILFLHIPGLEPPAQGPLVDEEGETIGYRYPFSAEHDPLRDILTSYVISYHQERIQLHNSARYNIAEVPNQNQGVNGAYVNKGLEPDTLREHLQDSNHNATGHESPEFSKSTPPEFHHTTDIYKSKLVQIISNCSDLASYDSALALHRATHKNSKDGQFMKLLLPDNLTMAAKYEFRESLCCSSEDYSCYSIHTLFRHQKSLENSVFPGTDQKAFVTQLTPTPPPLLRFRRSVFLAALKTSNQKGYCTVSELCQGDNETALTWMHRTTDLIRNCLQFHACYSHPYLIRPVAVDISRCPTTSFSRSFSLSSNSSILTPVRSTAPLDSGIPRSGSISTDLGLYHFGSEWDDIPTASPPGTRRRVSSAFASRPSQQEPSLPGISKLPLSSDRSDSLKTNGIVSELAFQLHSPRPKSNSESFAAMGSPSSSAKPPIRAGPSTRNKHTSPPRSAQSCGSPRAAAHAGASFRMFLEHASIGSLSGLLEVPSSTVQSAAVSHSSSVASASRAASAASACQRTRTDGTDRSSTAAPGLLRLRDRDVRKILFPLLMGLIALHDQGYIHGSLSLDCIFIGIDNIPRIGPGLCPFGQYYPPSATPKESLAHLGKRDVWALGVLLYELISGRRIACPCPDELVRKVDLASAVLLRRSHAQPNVPSNIGHVVSLTEKHSSSDHASSAPSPAMQSSPNGSPILSKDPSRNTAPVSTSESPTPRPAIPLVVSPRPAPISLDSRRSLLETEADNTSSLNHSIATDRPSSGSSILKSRSSSNSNAVFASRPVSATSAVVTSSSVDTPAASPAPLSRGSQLGRGVIPMARRPLLGASRLPFPIRAIHNLDSPGQENIPVGTSEDPQLEVAGAIDYRPSAVTNIADNGISAAIAKASSGGSIEQPIPPPEVLSSADFSGTSSAHSPSSKQSFSPLAPSSFPRMCGSTETESRSAKRFSPPHASHRGLTFSRTISGPDQEPSPYPIAEERLPHYLFSEPEPAWVASAYPLPREIALPNYLPHFPLACGCPLLCSRPREGQLSVLRTSPLVQAAPPSPKPRCWDGVQLRGLNFSGSGIMIPDVPDAQMPVRECPGDGSCVAESKVNLWRSACLASIAGVLPSLQDLPQTCSALLVQFISLCLDVDIHTRPTPRELLMHPFMLDRASDEELEILQKLELLSLPESPKLHFPLNLPPQNASPRGLSPLSRPSSTHKSPPPPSEPYRLPKTATFFTTQLRLTNIPVIYDTKGIPMPLTHSRRSSRRGSQLPPKSLNSGPLTYVTSSLKERHPLSSPNFLGVANGRNGKLTHGNNLSILPNSFRALGSRQSVPAGSPRVSGTMDNWIEGSTDSLPLRPPTGSDGLPYSRDVTESQSWGDGDVVTTGVEESHEILLDESTSTDLIVFRTTKPPNAQVGAPSIALEPPLLFPIDSTPATSCSSDEFMVETKTPLTSQSDFMTSSHSHSKTVSIHPAIVAPSIDAVLMSSMDEKIPHEGGVLTDNPLLIMLNASHPLHASRTAKEPVTAPNLAPFRLVCIQTENPFLVELLDAAKKPPVHLSRRGGSTPSQAPLSVVSSPTATRGRFPSPKSSIANTSPASKYFPLQSLKLPSDSSDNVSELPEQVLSHIPSSPGSPVLTENSNPFPQEPSFMREGLSGAIISAPSTTFPSQSTPIASSSPHYLTQGHSATYPYLGSTVSVGSSPYLPYTPGHFSPSVDTMGSANLWFRPSRGSPVPAWEADMVANLTHVVEVDELVATTTTTTTSGVANTNTQVSVVEVSATHGSTTYISSSNLTTQHPTLAAQQDQGSQNDESATIVSDVDQRLYSYASAANLSAMRAIEVSSAYLNTNRPKHTTTTSEASQTTTPFVFGTLSPSVAPSAELPEHDSIAVPLPGGQLLGYQNGPAIEPVDDDSVQELQPSISFESEDETVAIPKADISEHSSTVLLSQPIQTASSFSFLRGHSPVPIASYNSSPRSLPHSARSLPPTWRPSTHLQAGTNPVVHCSYPSFSLIAPDIILTHMANNVGPTGDLRQASLRPAATVPSPHCSLPGALPLPVSTPRSDGPFTTESTLQTARSQLSLLPRLDIPPPSIWSNTSSPLAFRNAQSPLRSEVNSGHSSGTATRIAGSAASSPRPLRTQSQGYSIGTPMNGLSPRGHSGIMPLQVNTGVVTAPTVRQAIVHSSVGLSFNLDSALSDPNLLPWLFDPEEIEKTERTFTKAIQKHLAEAVAAAQTQGKVDMSTLSALGYSPPSSGRGHLNEMLTSSGSVAFASYSGDFTPQESPRERVVGWNLLDLRTRAEMDKILSNPASQNNSARDGSLISRAKWYFIMNHYGSWQDHEQEQEQVQEQEQIQDEEQAVEQEQERLNNVLESAHEERESKSGDNIPSSTSNLCSHDQSSSSEILQIHTGTQPSSLSKSHSHSSINFPMLKAANHNNNVGAEVYPPPEAVTPPFKNWNMFGKSSSRFFVSYAEPNSSELAVRQWAPMVHPSLDTMLSMSATHILPPLEQEGLESANSSLSARMKSQEQMEQKDQLAHVDENPDELFPPLKLTIQPPNHPAEGTGLALFHAPVNQNAYSTSPRSPSMNSGGPNPVQRDHNAPDTGVHEVGASSALNGVRQFLKTPQLILNRMSSRDTLKPNDRAASSKGGYSLASGELLTSDLHYLRKSSLSSTAQDGHVGFQAMPKQNVSHDQHSTESGMRRNSMNASHGNTKSFFDGLFHKKNRVATLESANTKSSESFPSETGRIIAVLRRYLSFSGTNRMDGSQTIGNNDVPIISTTSSVLKSDSIHRLDDPNQEPPTVQGMTMAGSARRPLVGSTAYFPTKMPPSEPQKTTIVERAFCLYVPCFRI